MFYLNGVQFDAANTTAIIGRLLEETIATPADETTEGVKITW